MARDEMLASYESLATSAWSHAEFIATHFRDVFRAPDSDCVTATDLHAMVHVERQLHRARRSVEWLLNNDEG